MAAPSSKPPVTGRTLQRDRARQAPTTRRAWLVVAIASSALACTAIAGLKDVPPAAPPSEPDAAAPGDASADAISLDAISLDANSVDANSVDADSVDANSLDAAPLEAAVDAPASDACAAGCGTTAPFCINGACVAEPPSCQGGGPGVSNCGDADAASDAAATESCCTSPSVPGGTFYRSYDGVTNTSTSYPATVSSFRLDKYEVTVGRFRSFVNAAVAGWLPTVGAGVHTHVNGGKGLIANPGTGYELGWDDFWNGNLPVTLSDWNTALVCTDSTYPYATWTPIAGSDENRPINCLSWYAAYAFCIWDGGFLPSEAEWNYAAAGGSQQRVFPWSTPPTSSALDCTYANYSGLPDGGACSATGPNDVGSESPADLSRWGHSDLAGNVSEWALDWWGNYANPCVDCVNLEEATTRVDRGGWFSISDVPSIEVSEHSSLRPLSTFALGGFRCARAP